MTIGACLPSCVSTSRPLIRILRAEFEDVTDLHRLVDFQLAGVTARQDSPKSPCAGQPLIDLNVTFDAHAANVMVVFIRAGRHVAAVFQTEVGDD